MDMNLEEYVQSFGLFVSFSCGIFLLGNYGSEGTIGTLENGVMLGVAGTGGSVLVIITLWKIIAIRKESKEVEEKRNEGENKEEEKKEEEFLTEA